MYTICVTQSPSTDFQGMLLRKFLLNSCQNSTFTSREPHRCPIRRILRELVTLSHRAQSQAKKGQQLSSKLNKVRWIKSFPSNPALDDHCTFPLFGDTAFQHSEVRLRRNSIKPGYSTPRELMMFSSIKSSAGVFRFGRRNIFPSNWQRGVVINLTWSVFFIRVLLKIAWSSEAMMYG